MSSSANLTKTILEAVDPSIKEDKFDEAINFINDLPACIESVKILKLIEKMKSEK